MNINLFFDFFLFLFTILAINGIIYSLIFFTLKIKIYSKIISIIRNNSGKDVLATTLLIASSPIRLSPSESSGSQTSSLTSSESSTSQTLSVTSSESSGSQTLSVTSSDTLVSQGMFDSTDLTDLEINEIIMTQNSIVSDTNEEIIPSNLDISDHHTSLDSITVLDNQTFELWREIVNELHDLPFNTPPNILQQVKFEELNILYSQDLIQYAITQTELRLLIEMIPAIDLFKPDINHLILTMMSYYHQ